MSQQAAEYVTRGEFSAIVESLRDTRTELNSKLDSLINSRTAEAFSMGQLSSKIEQVEKTQKQQGEDIAELRKLVSEAKNDPKDAILKLLTGFVKVAFGAAAGYLLTKLHF